MLGIHPVTELWVSPFKRTMQTMQPIALGVKLSPQVRVDCFEAGGIYAADSTYTRFEPRGGLTREQMLHLFPSCSIPDYVNDDGWFPPEGSRTGKETDDECRARAAKVAANLKSEAEALSENKQVILVTHYDFICALLDELIIPGVVHQGTFVNWRHYNTGITVLDILRDGTVVNLMSNAVPHLVQSHDLLPLISGFDI